MEVGGEGIKSQVKEMSDREYLSVVGARRALAASGAKEPYVDRSEYPIDADIEYEVHWDKRRRRSVSRVPKWSQDEFASRTAYGGKQPNSASQATADDASSGTKALKRPCVEHPSRILSHMYVGNLDHPNSVSEAIARQYECYPEEFGFYLDERCEGQKIKIWQGPMTRPGLLPELKSRVVYPKRPRKDDAGVEVK